MSNLFLIAGLLVIGFADLAYINLTLVPSLLTSDEMNSVVSIVPNSASESQSSTIVLKKPSSATIEIEMVDAAVLMEDLSTIGAPLEEEPADQVETSKAVVLDKPVAEFHEETRDAPVLQLVSEFKSGRVEFSEDSKRAFHKIVTVMQDPTLELELSGHTDDEGDSSFNEELSRRRAERVAQWFYSQGIDEKRIHISHYGERQPLLHVGRKKQRRVEIRVMRK